MKSRKKGTKKIKRTRKKRGGWRRITPPPFPPTFDNIGYFYECQNKGNNSKYRENGIITGKWDELRPEDKWEIIKMKDSLQYDPILRLYDPEFGEFEMPAQQLCNKGYKPLKRNDAKTGAGRKKKKKRNKTKKNKSTKKIDKDFKPNLTPRQMFKMGSFGGTYWRPIKSKFHNNTLKNKHKKYSFLKDIPDKLMTKPFDEYDKNLNKYKKKVGTTLKFWESKGWMKESHPYGWVQWYCDYYSGKRSADDERQIKRWKQLAGPNGRFRKWLITMIMKKGGKDKWDDHSISPAIRQTLQHWGYKLTKKDFENELKNRKK